MIVKTFTFNPFFENTYVLADAETREAAVIDPGMSNAQECQAIAGWLQSEGMKVTKVLLTHCHVDHLMGTGFLHDQLGAVICGPEDDQLRLPSAPLQAQLFGVPLSSVTSPIAVNINEGDTVTVGNEALKVFDVAGHSHHGLCYYLEKGKMLFTGDVLFCESVGRSDFGPAMGGNHEQLIEGILCKLMSLPSDVKVFPGHGSQTTIGHEQNHNPFF